MEQRELKSLIEDGHYRPQPEQIAQAMLRRRGVRTLLTEAAFGRAGRIQPTSAARRQAA